MLDKKQQKKLQRIFERFWRTRNFQNWELQYIQDAITYLERENHDLTQAVRRLSAENTTN